MRREKSCKGRMHCQHAWPSTGRFTRGQEGSSHSQSEVAQSMSPLATLGQKSVTHWWHTWLSCVMSSRFCCGNVQLHCVGVHIPLSVVHWPTNHGDPNLPICEKRKLTKIAVATHVHSTIQLSEASLSSQLLRRPRRAMVRRAVNAAQTAQSHSARHMTSLSWVAQDC